MYDARYMQWSVVENTSKFILKTREKQKGKHGFIWDNLLIDIEKMVERAKNDDFYEIKLIEEAKKNTKLMESITKLFLIKDALEAKKTRDLLRVFNKRSFLILLHACFVLARLSFFAKGAMNCWSGVLV